MAYINKTKSNRNPHKKIGKYKVGDEVELYLRDEGLIAECPVCNTFDVDFSDTLENGIAKCYCCNTVFTFEDSVCLDALNKTVVSYLAKKEVKNNKPTGRASKGVLSPEKPFKWEGRAVTLFGVHIPPKKVFKPKKYITLKFVIVGIIPSKKNDFVSYNNIRQIMPTAVKKFGYTKEAFDYISDNAKSWLRGSKRYLEWLDEIDYSFREQMEYWRVKYDLVYPLDFVSIKNYYFFSDGTARDIISKDETIYDMLVTKRVINEDDYSVLHKFNSEAANYKGTIRDSILTCYVTLEVF
jgi:hypothetical protein